MNKKKTKKVPALTQLASTISEVCRELEGMLCNSDYDYTDTEVLFRALEQNPFSTVHDLAEAWAAKLNSQPNSKMLELFVELHCLLGREWIQVCAHHRTEELEDRYLREDEDDDVEDEYLLWGDLRVLSRRMREEENEEKAIARAWLDRQAKEKKDEAITEAWLKRQQKAA